MLRKGSTSCVIIKNSGNPFGSGPTGLASESIYAEVCGSGSQDCADKGNANWNAVKGTAAVQAQLLIGYRMPTGTTAPAEISASGQNKMKLSPSYTSELNRLAPRQGSEWFGYISDPFKYDSAMSVPSNAKPGRYEVKLNGELGISGILNNKVQIRSGTATLVVTEDSAVGDSGKGSGSGDTSGGGSVGNVTGISERTIKALKLGLRVPKKLKLRMARKGGIEIVVASQEDAKATLSLYQGKRLLKKRTVKVKEPDPMKVTLRSKRLKRGKFKIVMKIGERTFTKQGRLT